MSEMQRPLRFALRARPSSRATFFSQRMLPAGTKGRCDGMRESAFLRYLLLWLHNRRCLRLFPRHRYFPLLQHGARAFRFDTSGSQAHWLCGGVSGLTGALRLASLTPGPPITRNRPRNAPCGRSNDPSSAAARSSTRAAAQPGLRRRKNGRWTAPAAICF